MRLFSQRSPRNFLAAYLVLPYFWSPDLHTQAWPLSSLSGPFLFSPCTKQTHLQHPDTLSLSSVLLLPNSLMDLSGPRALSSNSPCGDLELCSSPSIPNCLRAFPWRGQCQLCLNASTIITTLPTPIYCAYRCQILCCFVDIFLFNCPKNTALKTTCARRTFFTSQAAGQFKFIIFFTTHNTHKR